jgi:type IV secretory pathway VirB9-like protein
MRRYTFYHLLPLFLLLLSGCTQEAEPPPTVPPPPEDLSTWTVPELVQPESMKPHSQAVSLAKLPAGVSEKVYAYKPGIAVDVPVAVGVPLDIILEPGEKVRGIVDGDRTPVQQGGEDNRPWQVRESTDGSGETLRSHIFVTVPQPGLTNGLTITTTRRVYYITCKSVQKSPIRVLRWHYPQEDPARTPDPADEAPGLLPWPEQPMRYHVGYELKGSHEHLSFFPRYVVDDGKKTFIVYPEVTLFESVPLLRLIGPNGPQLVNSRQFLNVVIVDQLIARAELRVGIGERAQTVTITRGTLRTITCPGDEACPVWPKAASQLARRPS